MGFTRVPATPLLYYSGIVARLRSWATDNFPQSWPLLHFSDEPTRFIPLRLTLAREPILRDEPALLINGFPSSARGSEFFQLRATLSPPSEIEDNSVFSIKWEVLGDGNTVVAHLTGELLKAQPDQPIVDIAAWYLARLRSACELTNRLVVPTRPSLRPRGLR